MMRAIARRTVSNESAKWRSGRKVERTVVILPRGRWKKISCALSHDERVAADHHRDVVVPSLKAAAFKVVEAEFAFHFFIGALGPITLSNDANDLCGRHIFAERRQDELRRLLVFLKVRPLNDQPLRSGSA